jgi:DNA-binding IclR family transcriptional regulator
MVDLAQRTKKKTKIARRVIEVLEYFNEDHPVATIKDIVRRYDHPQSSTSDLLSCLVEMGLLYKDARSRSYWPTPRFAAMGYAAKSPEVHYRPLFSFMDQLSRSTRRSVALFGMVGARVQIFHWSPAPNLDEPFVCRGSSEPLSTSAIGHLLMTTLDDDGLGLMLRRLYAEAPIDRRFDLPQLTEKIGRYRDQGHATGISGFLPDYSVTATLLPRSDGDRPLALGLFHPKWAHVDTQALLHTLERGIDACGQGKAQEMPSPPFLAAV